MQLRLQYYTDQFFDVSLSPTKPFGKDGLSLDVCRGDGSEYLTNPHHMQPLSFLGQNSHFLAVLQILLTTVQSFQWFVKLGCSTSRIEND